MAIYFDVEIFVNLCYNYSVNHNYIKGVINMGVPYDATEHEKDIRRALKLWRINSHTYQTIREDYKTLSKQADSLGINYTNLPLIANKEWPRMPFLLIKTEREAEEFLRKQDGSVARRVIRDAERLQDDYCYNTYVAYTKDLKYLIKHHGHKRGFGFDPNYPCTAAPNRTSGSRRTPAID